MANGKPGSFPAQSQNPPGLELEMIPEPEIIRSNYIGSGKLQNKIALITGGDSGIGRAVAVHFAREGADVAISYLDEHEDAEAVRAMVEAEGRKCLLFPGDIRNRAFCKTLIDRVVTEFGGIDILVNNAAEQHPIDDPAEIDLDVMERTFQTNIFAMFYLTKFALAHMSQGDAIINTTSVTNYRGSNSLWDYSSTKGAITAFTRTLGKLLAPKGIRVNGVAPGPVWTPLIPSTFDNVEEFGKNTPLGRAGQPSEVAPCYVFLASEDSSYMTSQIMHPNGGEVVNA
jgi:NAD(P)-dependent dehydrogenase (short-subunit alcohol dehydrogenase family)